MSAFLDQVRSLTGVQARALVSEYRDSEFDRVFGEAGSALDACEERISQAGKSAERDELFAAAVQAAGALCAAEPVFEDVLFEQATAAVGRDAGVERQVLKQLTAGWDAVVAQAS